MIQTDVNILQELFLSTEMWGLLGPAIMVTVTYLLGKKSPSLGVIWWVVSSLMAVYYYVPLALSTGEYNWHIVILILGGFLAVLGSNRY